MRCLEQTGFKSQNIYHKKCTCIIYKFNNKKENSINKLKKEWEKKRSLVYVWISIKNISIYYRYKSDKLHI